MTIKLEPSWLAVLQPEFDQEYLKTLKQFLVSEQQQHTVYPPNGEIFSAFTHTPFDKVRVVILGQDPYHGPGEAHGLSFSVKKASVYRPLCATSTRNCKAMLASHHLHMVT